MFQWFIRFYNITTYSYEQRTKTLKNYNGTTYKGELKF